MWRDVINISQREKIEKMINEKHVLIYKPTLGNINAYLEHQNWDVIPISKNEAFYLISLFHMIYTAAL